MMLAAFFLTPVEIIAACIGGILALLGLGKRRDPKSKKGKRKKGKR